MTLKIVCRESIIKTLMDFELKEKRAKPLKIIFSDVENLNF